jgi:ribosomal protein S18 acetylase RimI-like enzyme
MKISHFSSLEHQKVSDFWRKIFKEMDWKVGQVAGINDIPKFFGFPKGFLLVAIDKSQIVGCGGVRPFHKPIGIIKRFYIDSSFRGNGLASELLGQIINESRKRGFKELILNVHKNNLRAIRFYEKHGFVKYLQLPDDDWKESSSSTFFYYRIKLG